MFVCCHVYGGRKMTEASIIIINEDLNAEIYTIEFFLVYLCLCKFIHSFINLFINIYFSYLIYRVLHFCSSRFFSIYLSLFCYDKLTQSEAPDWLLAILSPDPLERSQRLLQHKVLEVQVRIRSWVMNYSYESVFYIFITSTLCTNTSSAPQSDVTKNEHAFRRRNRMNEKPVFMTQRQTFWAFR